MKRLKGDNRAAMERDLVRPVEHLALAVRPEEAGMRLDRFLKAAMPWRSRSKLVRLVQVGRVLVEDAPAKAARRLRAGERVTLRLPDPPAAIRPVEARVIHEDQALLVLDKPAGVLVHPVGRHRYDTLMNTLQLRYRRHGDPQGDRVPRLCHRIDRETSGILVVAKEAAAHADVQQQFERREVRKAYLAIVRGRLEGERSVELPLGLGDGAIRIKMAVRPDGRPARTRVRALRALGAHTLVEAEPLTGRQHQIRAHLEAIGHPVLCDPIYGRPGAAAPQAQVLVRDGRVLLARLALHAAYLCIRHPARGHAWMHIAAPLPADLQAAVEALSQEAAVPRKASRACSSES